MTKTACAITGAAVRIWGDVENDVVRTRGIARDSANRGQRAGGCEVVETQEISDAPRDVVVCAGSIATQTNSADELMTFCVETQAATKNVYATDFVPDHRVGRSAIARRGSRVSGVGSDGIAVLQSVEAAAGLHG